MGGRTAALVINRVDLDHSATFTDSPQSFRKVVQLEFRPLPVLRFHGAGLLTLLTSLGTDQYSVQNEQMHI